MQVCLELARRGAGSVSPNPMVGCVIVNNGQIIGEGYHERCGEAHAEVNAVHSVRDPELLTESTMYVTLEPCAHFGRTPPCSHLIVEKQIPRVVIGTMDPYAEVAGRGIEKLEKAGIDVSVGILKKECLELNKRFFTFHEKKRPYIILKWAQTSDGFIDIHRTEEHFGEPTWITGEKALIAVHQMRAEEDAILVGTNTALKDDPSLTVRHCEGRNPLRIVIDRKLKLPETLQLFDNSTPTLVINSIKNKKEKNTEWLKIDATKELILQVLEILYRKEILSLIVEGGRQTIENFISSGLWDEAHVFTGNKMFGKGVKAPALQGEAIVSQNFDEDVLNIFRNSEGNQ